MCNACLFLHLQSIFAVVGFCTGVTAPLNGGIGNCTAALLSSGTSCQPTCNAGYSISGPTTCIDGTLYSATCTETPTPCIYRVYDEVRENVGCTGGDSFTGINTTGFLEVQSSGAKISDQVSASEALESYSMSSDTLPQLIILP